MLNAIYFFIFIQINYVYSCEGKTLFYISFGTDHDEAILCRHSKFKFVSFTSVEENIMSIMTKHAYVRFVLKESVSDVTDTSYVSGEYLNIFKTVPTLFEYVLDVIEQKPGILEKDDITVFTNDAQDLNKIAILDDNVALDSETSEEQLQLDLGWGRDPGPGGRFGLSPVEVSEKTLEVEKQLEEHNNNRIRK